MISHSTPIIVLFPFDCTTFPPPPPPPLPALHDIRAQFFRAMNECVNTHTLAFVRENETTGNRLILSILLLCYEITSFPLFFSTIVTEFESLPKFAVVR